MENNISRLAMEIADDLLDEFYTKGITFGLNASDLSEVIQRTMDMYRQKQVEYWKEKGWLMGTQPFDPLVKI